MENHSFNDENWNGYTISAPSESKLSVVSSSADFKEETLSELYTHHCIQNGAEIPVDMKPVEDTGTVAGTGTAEDAGMADAEGTVDYARMNDATEKAFKADQDSAKDVEAFFLIRCDDNPPVKDAVFLLSAPNFLWIKARDWIYAPPCQLNIKLRANKTSTPLIQRLVRREKTARKRHGGKNFRNPTYLNTTNTVTILRGELEDEAEILASLPLPKPTEVTGSNESESVLEETLEPMLTSTPPGPQTPNSSDTLISENAELKDEIIFLKNSVMGLEKEVLELRNIMFSNEAVYKDLLKSYADLKKSAEKQSVTFNAESERQKEDRSQ